MDIIERTKKSIKKELEEIDQLINNNTVSAWEDDLEDVKEVAILEDFSKKPEGDHYIYNGWKERLENLIKKL